MTREFIEQLDVVEPNCYETDREEQWYKVGLVNGLKIADENPNLESLWHDASEEPLSEDKEIIFINEYGAVYITERFGVTFSYKFMDSYWEKYVNLLKISKWAYIKDLLPKGGER